MRNRLLLLSVVLALTAIPSSPSQTSGRTLKKSRRIRSAGAAGKRFDYLTIDTDDGYPLSVIWRRGKRMCSLAQ